MEKVELEQDLMPNVEQAFKMLDSIVAQCKFNRQESIAMNNALKVLYEGAKANEELNKTEKQLKS